VIGFTFSGWEIIFSTLINLHYYGADPINYLRSMLIFFQIFFVNSNGTTTNGEGAAFSAFSKI